MALVAAMSAEAQRGSVVAGVGADAEAKAKVKGTVVGVVICGATRTKDTLEADLSVERMGWCWTALQRGMVMADSDEQAMATCDDGLKDLSGDMAGSKVLEDLGGSA
jgi:hypothetical protein